ncbi:unnamed protein product [Brachionus calyciflorus]|uniref:Uncharacterized protein n=1 Tax=Brachionus calyciflorus TaxID=104777 RepID=A0A814G907_9BILA|nr:unnamed protein product [Brachionus calyciflorus]
MVAAITIDDVSSNQDDSEEKTSYSNQNENTMTQANIQARGRQLETIKDERLDDNFPTRKRKYHKDPHNPRSMVNSRKNNEEDIEVNSDSQSESSTQASSHSNIEHEKISSSSKQMESQF